MKILTALNNFARGKIDHDLNGRYDLPIYSTGADVFKNFFSNFKGNGLFRPGLEMMFDFQDCALMEFRFNNAQSYIVVMYNTKMRFLSYDENGDFGWVLAAGGGILEVATPYTLAHSKEIALRQQPQNADVMYIFHDQYAPRKLTRVSANSFTLATYVRTADPFDDPSTGNVGWPMAGCFYKGFLYCAAPTKKKTSIYRSQASSYDDFTTGTDDDDGFNFTVSDLTEPIVWVAAGNNSLICGSSQAVVAINGGSTDSAITPTTVEATITNTDGASSTSPIRKDQLLFYIQNLQRRINFFSYDLLTESFKSQDANFVSYDITKGTISKLVYIKDKNDLIYTLRGDGKLIALNFNESERVVGWNEINTDGEFIDIVRLSDNDGNINLFALVKRGSSYFIERLSSFVEFPLPDEVFSGNELVDKEAYWRLVVERLKECCYLDNSIYFSGLKDSEITFDGVDEIVSDEADFSSGDVGKRIEYATQTGFEYGVFEITEYIDANTVKVEVIRTPSENVYSSWYLTSASISGLTHLANKEVSVVGDGGYLGEYTVTAGGVLALDRQVGVAWIGYKYSGLIKTFNLGFQVQGINTQVTSKNLSKAFIRFVFSAGGKCGVSLYALENIQDFDPSGYYDLPPLPMDGDKEVSFTDDDNDEKCLYIVQDEPLPLNITAVFLEFVYGTKT